MGLEIARLAERITSRAVRPVDAGRYAAVSVLLHDDSEIDTERSSVRGSATGGPRVLLMKRSERAGDPWSGHISLPGGGYQPSDASLLTTAIRETEEELGIDLSATRFLGNLPPLQPRTSGPHGIEVTPFVFVTDVVVEPQCGPEALAAFWLPLELASSGALDGTYTHSVSQMTFPSWTYDGHVIWGLTWRILGDVLAASG